MSYNEVCSGWNSATAMATLNGKLYVIDSGTLYCIEESGEYAEVSSGWTDATLMTAMNGCLWLIHSGTLYQVEV